MKIQLSLISALMALGIMANGQEITETPQVEVGLNYMFTHVNPGSGLSSYNTNGGYGDVEYNLNKTFGIVADLGASRIDSANGIAYNNTSFEYLFGPRVNFRHGRWNPYVQALFGGQRYSNGFNPAATSPVLGVSQNNFAMAFGGGLDYALTNHIGIRPFQVEYLATQVSPGNVNYLQNNLRYSAGVVLRFGSK